MKWLALILLFLAASAVAQPITQQVAIVWQAPTNAYDVQSYEIYGRPWRFPGTQEWTSADRTAFKLVDLNEYSPNQWHTQIWFHIEDAMDWSFRGVEFNVRPIDAAKNIGPFHDPSTRFIDVFPPAPVRGLRFLFITNFLDQGVLVRTLGSTAIAEGEVPK